MSVPTPTNINLLHPNKFQLSFSRIPNSQFFCQDVDIPGLWLTPVARNTPFVEQYSPGDKLIYQPLNVSLLVDEGLQSWKEIHDWIRAMTFPTEFEEYEGLSRMYRTGIRENFYQFSDATLIVLSSSNNPIFRILFKEIFPEMLGSISLSTKLSPDDVLTVPVAFRYSYFNIEVV